MNDNKVTPDLEKPESIEELIFTALGTASMCWTETPRGVFESTLARKVGDDLCEKIKTDYVEPLQKELLELKAEYSKLYGNYSNHDYKINELIKECDALKAELSEAMKLLKNAKDRILLNRPGQIVVNEIESFLSKSKQAS